MGDVLGALRTLLSCQSTCPITGSILLTYAQISYIAAPVYMLCNGFTKLSLLSFYLHLSPQKWFRVSVWTSIVIVAIYTIVITFMMFFVCNPPRKAFDFKVVGGSCTDAAILYMATAVSNIVTDVILFVLPIRMIYKLHMPKIQKFGAIFVFGVGSLYVFRVTIKYHLPLTLLVPLRLLLSVSFNYPSF